MIDAAQARQLPGRANPIFLEGKLLPLKAEVAQSLNLRDGQVIHANLQARADPPMLLLRGLNLPMPPGNWRLPDGPMWVQVRQTEQGWSLQPTTVPAQDADPTQALISRLNQLLFRPAAQADTSQLLQSGILPRLLQALQRQELTQLWGRWQQNMSQMSAGMLARAVAGALGNEVWLARGAGAGSGVTDPRQLLRRLLQVLRELPDEEVESLGLDLGEAIRDIGASLDNLQSHQVQAAQAQAQHEMLLNLVIPFSDADPLELEFRRPARQGSERMPLTVNMHTRSQDLGELWLRTQLTGLQDLDLTMWALRAEVADMAREHSPNLTRLLTDAGLNMKSLQIVHGARPNAEQDWRPSGRGMVVDFSA